MKKNFLLIFLLITFDSHTRTHDFFDQFKRLKSNEWEKVCVLGNQALNDPKITLEESAEIHALLASTRYYLGDYESMLPHINACQAIASTIGSTPYLIRSQYLLSAYHRINRRFSDAVTSINQATTLFNDDILDALKAKVYFNAGAAHADNPEGDFQQAVDYYKQALALRDPLSDDSHRTSIRLAKSLMLLQNLTEARSVIQPLFSLELTPRTYVQLLYASAQLELDEGNLDRAIAQINEAIINAEKLKMITDVARLKKLRESVSG